MRLAKKALAGRCAGVRVHSLASLHPQQTHALVHTCTAEATTMRTGSMLSSSGQCTTALPATSPR